MKTIITMSVVVDVTHDIDGDSDKNS